MELGERPGSPHLILATKAMLRRSMHTIVNAPVDKVFNYLADYTRAREWALGNIESIEKTSRGPVAVGSTFTVGVRQSVHSGAMMFPTVSEGVSRSNVVVTEYVPDRRVVFEVQTGSTRMLTFFDLEPWGGGTRITMGYEWHQVRLLLMPGILLMYAVLLLLWPFVRWREARMLRRLKARLEQPFFRA